MNEYGRYLKRTIIAGLLFMIPVFIVGIIVIKVFQISASLAEPLGALIPIDYIGGIALVNILAVILLLLICFGAGLFARRAFMRGVSRAIESKLDLIYPRYAVIKAMTQAARDKNDSSKLIPVLARFDDNAQMGFEIERSETGMVTVFLPGSPDPWAGSVIHMHKKRISPLDVDLTKVVKILKVLGRGSSELLPPDIVV